MQALQTTPKRTRKKPRVLVEWEWKLPVIRHLAGIRLSMGDLVQKMIFDTPQYRDDPGILKRITDKAYQWDESDPTDEEALLFWECVREFLGISKTVYVRQLLMADIDSFIQLIPDREMRQDAKKWLDVLRSGSATSTPRNGVVMPEATPSDQDLYPIWNHDLGPIETIRTGLKKRKIDQKHYYMDSDSADAWNDLIGDKRYPTYDHCRFGLIELLDDPRWKAAIDAAKPSAVVMLAGGGAPSKDREIVRHLLNRSFSKTLPYYLVDISFYMLMSSKRKLEEYAREERFDQKLEVKALRRDILRMPAQDQRVFHQGGKVLFGITAGTIGNLSEEEFFRSLNIVSAPGDLLFIGADTLDGLSESEIPHLRKTYDNPALRHWLKPVVGVVLNAYQIRKPVEEVLNGEDIHIDFVPASDLKHSDVPGSYAVVVTLKLGENPTLLTSTRYDSEQLKHFAEERGWEPICTVRTPMEKSCFRQFAFRRKA